ncbi:MAG: hypothetical protein L6V93_07115 [Clostridiales bacterium]|nr:MAG: hypothetical protein L6V93_07115 [Clostridiales bacterium]
MKVIEEPPEYAVFHTAFAKKRNKIFANYSFAVYVGFDTAVVQRRNL